MRAAAEQDGIEILHTRGAEEIRSQLLDFASRTLLFDPDQAACPSA